MFFFTDDNGVENRGQLQIISRPGDAVPGSIVSITSPADRREGGQEIPWGGYLNFKALITNTVISEQTNHQFNHMFGGDIYLHVFGDRIGTLGIGGIAAYRRCGEEDGQPIGVSHVLNYYRQTKLSVRSEPLKVTLAPATVLRGFLFRFRGQVVSVEQRLFQFHLDMALVPEENL